jgi:hypothetical protein
MSFTKYCKELWIPALLILGWIIFVQKIGVSSGETREVVLGIILGTSLGFIVELIKRGLDSIRDEDKKHRAARALIAQDALNIYRTMELYKKLIHDPSVPKDFKDGMPPELDLKYWSHISINPDFILLAGEDKFSSYFEEMFDFEKVNEFIQEAKHHRDSKNEERFKQAFPLALAIYRDTVETDKHLKFALHFHSKEKLENLLKKRE